MVAGSLFDAACLFTRLLLPAHEAPLSLPRPRGVMLALWAC
jgi:hypothetical protein